MSVSFKTPLVSHTDHCLNTRPENEELQKGAKLTRTAADGAVIVVRLATLGPDGPTGGYFDDNGPVRW
jgi:hypothetical protein